MDWLSKSCIRVAFNKLRWNCLFGKAYCWKWLWVDWLSKSCFWVAFKRWRWNCFLAKFIVGNDFVRWLSKSCVRGAFAKGFLQLYFYIFSATDIIWLSALCPWYVLFIWWSCCQLEWKDFDVYLKYKYTWLACLPEPPALPLVVRPAENEYYFRKELITTIFSKII